MMQDGSPLQTQAVQTGKSMAAVLNHWISAQSGKGLPLLECVSLMDIRCR